MSDTKIIACPHCKKAIPLDDVLTHQVEEKIKQEYEKLRQQDKEKIIAETQKEISKQIQQQFELDLKNSHKSLEEERKRSQELIQQLTETNKLIRDLKRKDEERTLEMEKKLLESEEKIRLDAQKKVEEQQHLKLMEKDKQINDIKKQLEEAQRKAQQGSQQNQGEVLELEFEQQLKKEFPNDKISPVSKGIRGADVIQEVWDRTGVRCGIILWETKNAKWNSNWIDKLKSDQRGLKAEVAALISEHLPEDITAAAYRNGVWVTHRSFAIGMAMALRANLIQASFIKRSVQGKDEKKEILWNYLTSTSFTQRMEAILDTFRSMQEDLDREKRSYTKLWAKREMQIKRILENTYGLRGDLEGVMGHALPPMKQMELVDENEDLSDD